MSAPLLHIETSPTLPSEADVVVIGGGVVGVFTAYYLARSGVKVALVEKGRIAAEQSSRNWGWCRQQNRDARELPMATKASSFGTRLQKKPEKIPVFAGAAFFICRRMRRRLRAGPAGGILQNSGRYHAYAQHG